MNIPEKVKIGGIHYDVSEVDGMEYAHGLGGQILYQKATIQIEKSMSDEKKEQVFVHEMLHGCFEEAGFDEQEEDMINRVGKVLYQVLKDNKLYFGE